MIIQNYIERLKNNRGYSDNTVKNYNRTMEKFKHYLTSTRHSIERTETIDLNIIEKFISKQRELLDVKTCNNYLSCIKLFLKFCKVKGYNCEDYTKILFAREPKRKIEALNKEDTNKMFKYLKNLDPETKYGELIRLRNLVMLHLLVYTGLRVSELANIKVKDIGEELQIVGKGKKVRVVNLYEDDLRLINVYLFARRKRDSEYLFMSVSGKTKGKKLSTVSIEQIIREIWKAAGVKTKVYPHKLRHTFATELLRANANIVHIQKLMGHSSILTTQTYLTVLNSELRDTQKLLHK